MKRLGRGLIYLSAIAVFGLVLLFSSKQASAYSDCTVSMSGTGLTRTFTVTADPPGPHIGQPWQYTINGVYAQTRTITYPGYGTYRVNGRAFGYYKKLLRVGYVVQYFDYNCSVTFTISPPPPPPNQQALAWVSDINCSAADGALTFTASVVDPDGGTPGYYLSIEAVGDTGWIYRPNGSYGHGTWYPPRNGATYNIYIWAKDAQTGNQVGPGVYSYSCPSPPPPPPSPTITCILTAPGSIQITDQYYPSVTVTHGGPSGAPSITNMTVTFTIDGSPTPLGTYGPVTLNNGNTIPSSTAKSNVPYSNASPGAHTVTAQLTGSPGINQSCGSKTVGITVLPYLKVYGSDVIAGGGFQYGVNGSSCASNASSTINAYAEQVPAGGLADYRGASGQFGVTALMSINGFFSSGTRTSNPLSPKGLTFSNTGNTDASGTYGGGYAGSGPCITDYYGLTQNNPVAIGNINAAVASSPAGKSQYTVGNLGGAGDLTIPKGHQIAVYVNGNIFIDRNIIYDTAARATTNDIPFFALIVKGNIYIGPGVSRLDGLYIAQPTAPDTPTNGRIYTCAPSAGSYYTIATVYDNCQRQLVVNGALIAQQVKFMRTIFSLNQGGAREAPTDFANGTGTKAAEVINYTPEMYLAPSPLINPNASSAASGIQPYDAIFSLPPVF